MRPDSLAVLGLGALGASAARRARREGVARVVGWSPSRSEGVAALQHEAVHDVVDRLDRAVTGATLVLVARPFVETLALLPRLLSAAGPETLIAVVTPLQLPLRRALPRGNLADGVVGLHPLAPLMADAPADPNLDPWPGLLTYICGGDSDAGHASARSLSSFVEEVLGAAPVLIDAARHDEQVAWSRELAPTAAAVLAHLLAGRDLGGVSWDPAVGQISRALPTDAAGWAALLVANRGPVGEALAALGEEAVRLGTLIAAGDQAGVERFLATAAAFRPAIR